MAKLACKLDCRNNSDPTELGDCMRGCMEVARSAKDVCRAVFKACKQTCEGATTTSTIQSSTTSTAAPTTTTSTTLPSSPSPAFVE